MAEVQVNLPWTVGVRNPDRSVTYYGPGIVTVDEEFAAARGWEPVEVDATDGAKQLAKENNIDLATVTGTGADGRITKADVEKAIGS